MDLLGDHLLADTRLAQDEHCRLDGSKLSRQMKYLHHRRVGDDDPVARVGDERRSSNGGARP